MCFALKPSFAGLSCGVFAALVAAVVFVEPSFADSAFVTQASKGGSSNNGPSISFPMTPPNGGIMRPTPETAVPATGGNFASTLEMGRNNFVFQSQSGSGNFSNVGIFGGVSDNVGVFQRGHGLSSNLLLVGAKGLTVDVVQTPGAPPVNALFARMPNGTLQLFGVSPANISLGPHGALVLR